MHNAYQQKYTSPSDIINNWIKTLNDADIKEFHNIKNPFVHWKDEIVNSFIRFGERRLHHGYI